MWTVSGGAPYAGKPRPAVIIQEDRFAATNSITLCAFTTDPPEAPLLRMLVEPTDRNGLSVASRLMIDKVTTVPKTRLGKRIGKLHDEDIVRLDDDFDRKGSNNRGEAVFTYNSAIVD